MTAKDAIEGFTLRLELPGDQYELLKDLREHYRPEAAPDPAPDLCVVEVTRPPDFKTQEEASEWFSKHGELVTLEKESGETQLAYGQTTGQTFKGLFVPNPGSEKQPLVVDLGAAGALFVQAEPELVEAVRQRNALHRLKPTRADIVAPATPGSVPDAFRSGDGAIANNPPVAATMASFWTGGTNARDLVGGWVSAAGGVPVYEHLGNTSGAKISVYPDTRRSADDELLATAEKLWLFVEGLDHFTGDVLLAMLAQMSEPSVGKRPQYPMREPVQITADAILSYQGIRRYGADKRLLLEKIHDEVEKIRAMRFDVEGYRLRDPKTDKREGRSWQGDQLINVVKVEQWQESLFGERESIEVAWSIRAGQWAEYWFNAQGRAMTSRMARTLLELDHRENRGAAVLAKKIGMRFALLVGSFKSADKLKPRRVRKILEEIGELPRKEKRPKDWGRRIRKRFNDAMAELENAGIFTSVEWIDGLGPDVDIRFLKGAVEDWLDARILIRLPDAAPELPALRLELVAGTVKPRRRRKRRATPHRQRKTLTENQRRAMEELKGTRLGRGLNQKELGEKFSVSQVFISKMERGTSPPGVELTEHILAWLDNAGPE